MGRRIDALSRDLETLLAAGVRVAPDLVAHLDLHVVPLIRQDGVAGVGFVERLAHGLVSQMLIIGT